MTDSETCDTVAALGVRAPARLPRSLRALTALAIVAAGLCAAPARAADKHWLCPNAFWDIVLCWTGSALPAAGDTVYVNAIGGADTWLRVDSLTGTQTVNALWLNSTGQATARLQIIDGTLKTGMLVVGDRGAGVVDLSNNGTLTSSWMVLGNRENVSGSFNLSGGTLNTAYSFIGASGTGSFIQTNGSFTAGMLYLGSNPDLSHSRTGVGSYAISKGTLNVTGALATVSGTGNFTQSGGVVNVSSLSMASSPSGRGHYLLSAGSFSNSGSLVSGLGQSSFLQTGGAHTVSGNMEIDSGNSYVLEGGTLSAAQLLLAGGSFTQTGGSFTTGVIGSGDSAGRFTMNAGSLAVSGSISVGTVEFGSGASFALAAGRSLAATTLNNAGSLTQQGAVNLKGSASNDGSWTLSGGSITLAGTLANAGLFSGQGRISGSGALVNTGLVQQGAGSLELATTGANQNAGNWDLLAGYSLRLTGSTLSNSGAIALNGGTVSGNGQLVNLPGGTVSGRGSITAGFSNAGRVVVAAANTTIAQAFTNSGSIVLSDAPAALSGGLITNTGRIEGQGLVVNAVRNTGAIEAKGGTLWLAGALTQTGLLRSASGSELVVGQGLASNDGRIELAGGGFNNNGAALANAAQGRITGYGSLHAGSVANAGQIQLSGGVSEIHGSFVNLAGGATLLSGASNTSFYDAAEFRAGSELRVSAGSVATFFGAVQQRSGAAFTGTGSKFFEGGLSIGASPGLASDAGSVSFGDANTYLAEIGGTAPGSGFDHYTVAGQLSLGGSLRLVSWNGFVGQAGQRFDLFDWGSASGHFAFIDSSGLLLANGAMLDTSQLYVDGSISITAVPEPAGWATLLAGLAVVAGRATRRQRRGRGG